jgi:hypothetical protein
MHGLAPAERPGLNERNLLECLQEATLQLYFLGCFAEVLLLLAAFAHYFRVPSKRTKQQLSAA